MPRYVIERELPGAGKLSPEELQGISQTSCDVLRVGSGEQGREQGDGRRDLCTYTPERGMIREKAERAAYGDKVAEVRRS